MSTSSFDYVIVGGGLAGLVLAARLSEDANIEVFVIEAGEDQTADPRVTIPGMWPTLIRSESAWNFSTVPQEGLQNREIGFPLGKLLGGSSALNGLSFSATSKTNVDAWEGLGNPGWGWSRFVKSMKKSYTLGDAECPTGGPIQLSAPEDDSEWPDVWKRTIESLGFPTTGGTLDGEFSGSAVALDAVQPATKQRSYSANAAEAEKILFDTSNKTVATGVQLTKDGETKIVNARKEVIVTAGTINSPKLLELSGVGHAALLKSVGIDVVIDNPNVGENLQNHPMCTFNFEVRDEEGFDTIDKLARQDGGAIAAAMDAYSKQKGPFSKSGANLIAQLPTPRVETGGNTSELVKLLRSTILENQQKPKSFEEYHEAFVHSVLSSPTEASGCYLAIPGYAGATGDGWMAPTPAGDEKYLTITLLLAHPLSRGSVHLNASPSGAKILAIDPKYLTHPLDVEVMARHLQVVEKIASTEPLASHLKLDGKRSPSAPPYGSFADLDVAKDYLHKTAIGAHHFTGTCSMMPQELGGVVDAQLRVYGCQNLRVCDASIIPITPRTNPQATVYGVAEHAAAIIKSGL
ncbi:hypothetical protein PFICI_13173 [Pestalotiopsis fici W106-1]|uniref:Glucose-methanol-choline oxidoreductase N-terminal domain-containing protein n=1 Tax=Pestalotiopsis fici (strain W106-1 / CGMCC3.15140) TaxID=1229662 RepID=W3WLP1_PESFW|nr:uncharacterized protein PFICI_13173 [Pestalotiopsis fici W106-1]ETS74689.1 hypothetical protein PFICI_13173 [Pestalotiopsis fici W106-1]